MISERGVAAPTAREIRTVFGAEVLDREITRIRQVENLHGGQHHPLLPNQFIRRAGDPPAELGNPMLELDDRSHAQGAGETRGTIARGKEAEPIHHPLPGRSGVAEL